MGLPCVTGPGTDPLSAQRSMEFFDMRGLPQMDTQGECFGDLYAAAAKARWPDDGTVFFLALELRAVGAFLPIETRGCRDTDMAVQLGSLQPTPERDTGGYLVAVGFDRPCRAGDLVSVVLGLAQSMQRKCSLGRVAFLRASLEPVPALAWRMWLAWMGVDDPKPFSDLLRCVSPFGVSSLETVSQYSC